MEYDYIIQSDLIIEYIDINGTISKTHTNRQVKKYYINVNQFEDSDYEEEYKKQLNTCILENTRKKMLFENDNWIKESYRKRYEKKLLGICPRLNKLIRVYKNYIALEINLLS
jgi:hypothetical protein